jgi:hypothetical protein
VIGGLMSALLAIAAPAALSSRAVHEIHSTLTVARLDDVGIELRIRVFADDLSRVVAERAGRAMPADSSVRAAELERYVRTHVGASTSRGEPVPLEPCGVERVREVYMLCYRSARGAGPVATLRNSMLTDLHEDQVNVVQVSAGRSRRSHLLTMAAPSAELRPR